MNTVDPQTIPAGYNKTGKSLIPLHRLNERRLLFIYLSTQLTNTVQHIIHSNRSRSFPTLADFPWKLNENFITVLTLRLETDRVMAFVEHKKRLIRSRSALCSPFALASWQHNYRLLCCNHMSRSTHRRSK